MADWHKLSPLSASIVIAVSLLTACGGQSENSDGSGRSGGAGGLPQTNGGRSGTSGGSSAGGAATSGGSMTAGGSLASGGSVEGGSGGRSEESCEKSEKSYLGGIEYAKQCNPELDSEQCTVLVPSSLPCGCATFVNAALVADAGLGLARTVHSKYGCGANADCYPCVDPTRGFCSPSGRCEDRYTTGAAACVVNGTVFEHGASVPDPFSCNRCECVDGEIAGCTEIGCGTACPPDTIAGSRCVSCSPFGGCTSVETACHQPCDASCPSQRCRNGICQNFCPILPF